MSPDPYREFRQAVERGEDKIDLGRAALTIALTDYPALDISSYLARIEQFAVEVVSRCGTGGDPYHWIAALNSVLFEQHGFRGNRDDYYDPKNSFLNEVLERKVGIPITLSILYMEVAHRVGLALEGVGFPGHFMVKHEENGVEIVIDPFDGGAIKTREELTKLLAGFSPRAIELRPEFLRGAGKKEILLRMLGNLKGIYVKTNDWVRLLSVLDRIIILQPAGIETYRDRGSVYAKLECFAQARTDFEAYLRLAPEAGDAQLVRDQLVELAKHVTLIH